MECIWAHPAEQGITVREVFEALYERRQADHQSSIAYTTVMSTMTRLAKKNLLRVEKQELAYVYFPLLTQQEFISRFVGRILEDLLVNFTGETLQHLDAFSQQQMTAQMRHLLDEITRRRAVEEKE
jgi:predicted transcriptional regulator